MIRIHKNELFPIMASLIDESTGNNASGETVYYDVRYIDDSPLSIPICGVLPESSVEQGIYKKGISIPNAGTFIWYATCSGYPSGSEEIMVDEQDSVSANRHYNISVEDVVRTTASGSVTPSQIARNVPLNETDYIITRVKADDANDWSNPVASGIVHAWYSDTTQELPYKMGGPGV